MTRRKNWDGVGEPLFGEDWWVADQQLFEDSVARKAARAPARRRPRRPSAVPGKEAAAEQGMLPWFEDSPGDADELLRGDGPRALGAVAPEPVRDNPGSGQLLLGPWQPGEGYLGKAGRLGQARRQAEEMVLTELILLEPEQSMNRRPGTNTDRGGQHQQA
jgi:hypothetical protein